MIKNILGIKVVHAATTVQADPLQKFRYRLTIQGIPSNIGFQKCSALGREIETQEYYESNKDTVTYLRGRVKFPELTLERGMYSGDSALEGLIKESLSKNNNKHTILIELLDVEGLPARSWTLQNAWATKWESNDFDASSSDIAIEKLTLRYEDILE